MKRSCLVLIAALAASPAAAHVSLESKQATIGAPYKAVFVVPHGCAGSPTVKIRVQVPEGVIAVKPMPKPGWTLQTRKGKYEKSYQLYGETLTTGVKEVDWSGGNLPDEFYDEFVFRASLAADLPAGQMLYFPVVQECGDATDRWIEIPAAGQDEDALETPAPGIKLLPKK